jgi:hypothetical protein
MGPFPREEVVRQRYRDLLYTVEPEPEAARDPRAKTPKETKEETKEGTKEGKGRREEAARKRREAARAARAASARDLQRINDEMGYEPLLSSVLVASAMRRPRGDKKRDEERKRDKKRDKKEKRDKKGEGDKGHAPPGGPHTRTSGSTHADAPTGTPADSTPSDSTAAATGTPAGTPTPLSATPGGTPAGTPAATPAGTSGTPAATPADAPTVPPRAAAATGTPTGAPAPPGEVNLDIAAKAIAILSDMTTAVLDVVTLENARSLAGASLHVGGKIAMNSLYALAFDFILHLPLDGAALTPYQEGAKALAFLGAVLCDSTGKVIDNFSVYAATIAIARLAVENDNIKSAFQSLAANPGWIAQRYDPINIEQVLMGAADPAILAYTNLSEYFVVGPTNLVNIKPFCDSMGNALGKFASTLQNSVVPYLDNYFAYFVFRILFVVCCILMITRARNAIMMGLARVSTGSRDLLGSITTALGQIRMSRSTSTKMKVGALAALVGTSSFAMIASTGLPTYTGWLNGITTPTAYSVSILEVTMGPLSRAGPHQGTLNELAGVLNKPHKHPYFHEWIEARITDLFEMANSAYSHLTRPRQITADKPPDESSAQTDEAPTSVLSQQQIADLEATWNNINASHVYWDWDAIDKLESAVIPALKLLGIHGTWDKSDHGWYPEAVRNVHEELKKRLSTTQDTQANNSIQLLQKYTDKIREYYEQQSDFVDRILVGKYGAKVTSGSIPFAGIRYLARHVKQGYQMPYVTNIAGFIEFDKAGEPLKIADADGQGHSRFAGQKEESQMEKDAKQIESDLISVAKVIWLYQQKAPIHASFIKDAFHNPVEEEIRYHAHTATSLIARLYGDKGPGLSSDTVNRLHDLSVKVEAAKSSGSTQAQETLRIALKAFVEEHKESIPEIATFSKTLDDKSYTSISPPAAAGLVLNAAHLAYNTLFEIAASSKAAPPKPDMTQALSGLQVEAGKWKDSRDEDKWALFMQFEAAIQGAFDALGGDKTVSSEPGRRLYEVSAALARRLKEAKKQDSGIEQEVHQQIKATHDSVSMILEYVNNWSFLLTNAYIKYNNDGNTKGAHQISPDIIEIMRISAKTSKGSMPYKVDQIGAIERGEDESPVSNSASKEPTQDAKEFVDSLLEVDRTLFVQQTALGPWDTNDTQNIVRYRIQNQRIGLAQLVNRLFGYKEPLIDPWKKA